MSDMSDHAALERTPASRSPVPDLDMETNAPAPQPIHLPPYSADDPAQCSDGIIRGTLLSLSKIARPLAELPLEIWYLILYEIDDYRSLLMCRCVCKTLRDLAIPIIEKRRSLWAPSLQLSTLSRRLTDDPTLGHLLRNLAVPVSQFATFAAEFVGRIHNVESLGILAYSDEMLALRMQSRLALTQYRSVVRLRLDGVTFTTFSECIHVLCSLKNLREVTMADTSYARESCGARCTMDRPVAKDLQLQSAWFEDDKSSLLTCHLLSASRFTGTLTSLRIVWPDAHPIGSPVAYVGSRKIHQISLANPTNLRHLFLQLVIDETSDGPTCTVPDFLSKVALASLEHLSITYDYMACTTRQFGPGSDGRSPARIFGFLDDVLDSPCFPVLERLTVVLENLLPEDADYIAVAPMSELPFRALRTWELLELHVSSRESSDSDAGDLGSRRA